MKRGGPVYLARRIRSADITSPTARFNGGFNTGVRGGYEWGPWRVEEEYSYRQNGARDVVGSNFTVNAAGGDRHSNSIMTNVLYDFTPGYPITPHVGFGIKTAKRSPMGSSCRGLVRF